MDKIVCAPGAGLMGFKRSFKRGLRPMLTVCSDGEFRNAFPSLTSAEKERLHRLFIRVITSLYEDVEEEVELILCETQASTVFDTVDKLVEEYNLDPLFSKRSPVGEIAQNLSEAKKYELNHLRRLVEKAEEEKRKMKARVEVLKNDKHEFSAAVDLVHEMRTGISRYNSFLSSSTVDL